MEGNINSFFLLEGNINVKCAIIATTHFESALNEGVYLLIAEINGKRFDSIIRIYIDVVN